MRPYGKDSYRTIHSKLNRSLPEPFAGSSMRGNWDTDGCYVVRSYATIIAIYDPSDRTLYENMQSYSVTTSRHQHMVRYSLGYLASYHVECDGASSTSAASRNLAPIN